MRQLFLTSILLVSLICVGSQRTFAYVCGDVNNDAQHQVNIQDIVYLLRYLFIGGAPIPNPVDRANVNCSASPNPTIGDLTYLVNFCFNNGSVPCAFCAQNAYEIHIEKTHNTPQGEHEYVDVRLENGLEPLSSFNFLIAYNSTDLPAVLTLSNVQPGVSLFDSSGCGWEYFTFTSGSFGACGDACAINKVRVTGLADMANGAQHPSCFFPDSLPSVLFTLDFLVSDSLIYECQYIPVRFVWFDCQDNTITNRQGSRLLLSRNVYDFDIFGNITDSTVSYPTFKGAQICAAALPSPLRFIDFNDGGVDISCEQPEDITGDINLNFLAYEPADAILFVAYFMQGTGVFTIDTQRQIEASDVNEDGIPLGIADFVYLWGVIIGSFTPAADSTQTPPAISATYTVTNGQISIDSAVAGVYIVVEGDVTPVLLTSADVNLTYEFNGSGTSIVISPFFKDSIASFSGPVVDVGAHTVLSAEFSTPLGGVVNATRVDAK